MAGSSMHWNANLSDDEDESEIEFTGRAGMILLIDCAAYMFEVGGSKFHETLEIMESIMRNKIISNEKDLVGVVFYNTAHSPAPDNDTEFELQSGLLPPKHSAIFLPLCMVSADNIRQIRHMQQSDDCFDFANKYGHSTDNNLANVLWLCSRMFSRCGYKLEQSSVVIFTTNDEPLQPSSHEYKQAFTKARDLQQQDVNVTLVPMCSEFDCGKFYRLFLCTIANESEDQFYAPQYDESKDNLLSRIFCKDYKKRALVHLKFFLSSELALGVNVYSLSRKSRYPNKVTLLRDTNERVVEKHFYQACEYDEDGEPVGEARSLLPGELRKTQFIGGEKLTFKAEEVKNMKQMLPPGLRLLGFKPATKMSLINHLRSPLFLYPNEGFINGSTTLFRALHEKCLARQQIAYCMLTMRRKQPSKMVALVAQEEAVDDSGQPYRPAGFRVEFIPFAADIRDLAIFKESTAPDVTTEQRDLFRRVIKKVKFRFHPANFDNPALTHLYINMEALLFDTQEMEMDDSTRPDSNMIDAKMEPLIDELKELFVDDLVAATKRKRNDDSEQGASKATRSNDAAMLTATAVTELFRAGKESTLSVSSLKTYLQNCGISGLSKLNKSALIDKLREHHDL